MYWSCLHALRPCWGLDFHNAPSLTSSVVLICFLLSLEPHVVLCCMEQVAESSNVLILPVKPQMDMLHRTLHPDSAMMMWSRGFHVDTSGVNAQYILSLEFQKWEIVDGYGVAVEKLVMDFVQGPPTSVNCCWHFHCKTVYKSATRKRNLAKVLTRSTMTFFWNPCTSWSLCHLLGEASLWSIVVCWMSESLP